MPMDASTKRWLWICALLVFVVLPVLGGVKIIAWRLYDPQGFDEVWNKDANQKRRLRIARHGHAAGVVLRKMGTAWPDAGKMDALAEQAAQELKLPIGNEFKGIWTIAFVIGWEEGK